MRIDLRGYKLESSPCLASKGNRGGCAKQMNCTEGLRDNRAAGLYIRDSLNAEGSTCGTGPGKSHLCTPTQDCLEELCSEYVLDLLSETLKGHD